MRILLALLLIFSLVACSPRASEDIVTKAPGVGSEYAVFIGTTRAPLAPGRFSATERGPLGFARYTVSVPPDLDPGLVTVAKQEADPETDYVVRDVRALDAAGFREALSREMRAQGTREVVLFVHGFNNTLADGMFRITQMKHDLDLSGVAVHFAWPSAANPLGYVGDRDSALFSRAGLADLLDEVARAGARDIVLVAHSMGAFLSMETLIWMHQRGNRPGIRNLEGVVLLSPDIDVELFRSQAEAMGGLPQPFFIFTSSKDRALRLSARLTGQQDRLGSVRDFNRVADLEVALIDVTNVRDGTSTHYAALSSPSMLELLRQATAVDASFANDPTARVGLLPGTVLTVQNASAVIVAPPG